ncbi:F-box only protein 39-like [Lingula anatina]|uniref:F-box only protein 39-like n=1 Tax=Lingula anatina TaxID=7574 RepID=A0A2R2MT79_LINAN|nr:F-box only protein 39-like [Lingula anatina]|eukprot:XP_023933318.1 F-box only protein 39-like [Lingula anatina]
MDFEAECDTDWGVVPDILLVTIFQYLSDADRGRAARVCKRWAQISHSPCLWRKRIMRLGAVDAVEERKALRFAQLYGSHLRHLTIYCSKRRGNTRKRFQRVMCQILEHLATGQCQLIDLNIPRMEFYRFWRFDFYREKLLKSVCRFLHCQNSLRSFNMHAARLNIFSGSQLLEAVADGSGQTLEVLNIEDYYHDMIQCFRVPKFVNTLKKFTNLSILYLNYNYISDFVLCLLADNCGGKLRYLSIKVHRKDPHSHVTEKSSWRLLTNTCPELGVAVEFDHIGTYRDISAILVPGIPLKCLQPTIPEYCIYLILNISALKRLHVCANGDNEQKRLEVQEITNKYQAMLQTQNLDFRFFTDIIFEEEEE